MHYLKSIIQSVIKGMARLLVFVLAGFLIVNGVVAIAAGGLVWYYNSTLPSYTELLNRDVPESSKVYSRDGTLLYEFHGEYKRTSVPLSEISPSLKQATIAVEDKNFYSHGAISVWGIGRAMLANSQAGGVVQGGSTITQQFVKNALLDDRSRSLSRKIREVLLAYKIEHHFSKDEILELYLNEIPYGRNAYGVEAASQTYFGKSARDLNLAESAYIAALPQAPSYLNPGGPNRADLDDRKNLVLERMAEQGFITTAQLAEAQTATVAFKESKVTLKAPYFVSWIQNYLTATYGPEFLREGGLKVYTTLDLKLQSLAEQVVRDGVAKTGKQYGFANAALVAVEPSSGKVLAMVGGKDYFGTPEPAGCKPGVNCRFEPNTNVAASERQPGSSFKPYAYVTAFGSRFAYNPTSKIIDAPTTFGGGYSPQNYDGSYHGVVTMRKALAGSLNVPAVKVAAMVGPDNVVKTAKSLGISSPLQNCGLTVVLGGCEIKLVDHVGAMATLANQGLGHGATPFLKIEDKHGKVLEQYQAPKTYAVEPEAAYELISIMTDDSARQYIFGSKTPLTLPGRVVAAKTGTTQQWKDGWTMGFTPQLAAGVWVGNNDGTLMKSGADGVFTAAPLWHQFMLEALADQPAVEFPVPQGIVQVAMNVQGQPVQKLTAGGHMEAFAWYSLPKDLQTPALTKRGNKGNLFVPLIPSSIGGSVAGARTP
jgi:1A family penicillin-binding protein